MKSSIKLNFFLILCLYSYMVSCSHNSLLRQKDENYMCAKSLNLRQIQGLFTINSNEFMKDLKEHHKSRPSVHEGHCFAKIKSYYYDLNQLDSNNGYFITDKNGQTLIFNFCKNVKNHCANREGLIVSSSRCQSYGSYHKIDKIWRIEKDHRKNTVLKLILPEGDICQKNRTSVIRYQTTYEITCDNDVTIRVTNDNSFDSNKCQNTIKLRSKFGNK